MGNFLNIGSRLNFGLDQKTTGTKGRTEAAATTVKTTPAKPAGTSAVTTAATISARDLLTQNISVLDSGILPLDRFVPRFAGSQTATTLAQSAINQLSQADRASLEQAINAVRSKNAAADRLMDFIEESAVRFNEVLSELASGWQADTQRKFAAVFSMEPDKLTVMDSIVSIAILNDPNLETEIKVENMSDSTEADLLENRRIVWQYPPPGTPLDPPYVVLVAVEHRDISQAEGVAQSIFGNLIAHQGYKIPKAAAQKLGGRALDPGIRASVLSTR